MRITAISVEFDGDRTVQVDPAKGIRIMGDEAVLYRQELKFLNDIMQLLRETKDHTITERAAT